MHHPTDRIAHITAFVTTVVEHWLEREIAQWVHHMKDRSDDPSHHERTPLTRSYISLRALPHVRRTKYCIVSLNGSRNKEKQCVKKGRKRIRTILFNDEINTFLFTISYWIYCKGLRRQPERKPVSPHHGLLFPISSKVCYIYTKPQTG